MNLINCCLQVQTVFNMCFSMLSCWRDNNFGREWTALKSCFCLVLYPRHWLSNAELLVLFTLYHCQPDSDFVFCVRLTVIMARLHSNEHSCNGKPQRAFYGKAMEDADTSCSTRKGRSPRGNVYLPRQRCTVKGTCGPTAQGMQKQPSSWRSSCW